MQQRNKRFLKIWAVVIAQATAVALLGFGIAFILVTVPKLIAAALVIAAFVVFAGWMTWQIAKLKLVSAELKEARLFRELSKDIEPPPSQSSYAAAMKARLNV